MPQVLGFEDLNGNAAVALARLLAYAGVVSFAVDDAQRRRGRLAQRSRRADPDRFQLIVVTAKPSSDRF